MACLGRKILVSSHRNYGNNKIPFVRSLGGLAHFRVYLG